MTVLVLLRPPNSDSGRCHAGKQGFRIHADAGVSHHGNAADCVEDSVRDPIGHLCHLHLAPRIVRRLLSPSGRPGYGQTREGPPESQQHFRREGSERYQWREGHQWRSEYIKNGIEGSPLKIAGQNAWMARRRICLYIGGSVGSQVLSRMIHARILGCPYGSCRYSDLGRFLIARRGEVIGLYSPQRLERNLSMVARSNP
jgi:hypothetical protein